MTTDREPTDRKQTDREQRRLAEKGDSLTANNADWLRRAILTIFLLSPEPSGPNPHLMTKPLRRNQ